VFSSTTAVRAGAASAIATDRFANVFAALGRSVLTATAAGEPGPEGALLPLRAFFTSRFGDDLYVGLPGYARVALPTSAIEWQTRSFSSEGGFHNLSNRWGAALSETEYLVAERDFLDNLGDFDSPWSLALLRMSATIDEPGENPPETEVTEWSRTFELPLQRLALNARDEQYALALSLGQSNSCAAHVEWVSRGTRHAFADCLLLQDALFTRAGAHVSLWVDASADLARLRLFRWEAESDTVEELVIAIASEPGFGHWGVASLAERSDGSLIVSSFPAHERGLEILAVEPQ
jgi:hypothetical protein